MRCSYLGLSYSYSSVRAVISLSLRAAKLLTAVRNLVTALKNYWHVVFWHLRACDPRRFVSQKCCGKPYGCGLCGALLCLYHEQGAGDDGCFLCNPGKVIGLNYACSVF